MSGFKRQVQAHIPNAQYTMFATEAKIRIASTGSIGVNCRIKLNDLDEAGQPQKEAGRSLFQTFWLTEAAIEFYCNWLDALGFITDDEGDYLLHDGTKMPNPVDGINPMTGEPYKKDDSLPFLVGLPFVATTFHSVNTNPKTGADGDQYRFNYKKSGGKVVLSQHPSKADIYAAAMSTASYDGANASFNAGSNSGFDGFGGDFGAELGSDDDLGPNLLPDGEPTTDEGDDTPPM